MTSTTTTTRVEAMRTTGVTTTSTSTTTGIEAIRTTGVTTGATTGVTTPATITGVTAMKTTGAAMTSGVDREENQRGSTGVATGRNTTEGTGIIGER